MKKIFQRVFALLLAAALLLPGVAFAEYQPPSDLSAEAVYFYNVDTGTVLYTKNPDQKMYPASLTKVMTAVVTLERVADLDGEMAEYKLYMQDALYGKNAQLGGINLGEKVSIRGLLYAALLRSANESALMLADYVGGSQAGFVELMNEKARALGLDGTHFANANGLHDPENYTTARDMATLCGYAMQNETFAAIVKEYYVDIGPTSDREHLYEQSTNAMLSSSSPYYYAPACGIKTGTLDEAGRCLAAAASQNGYTYLCVLLGAPLYNADGTQTAMVTFDEAKALFQWAFEGFAVRTVVNKGEVVSELPVRFSANSDYVRLVTGEAFTQLLPNEIDVAGIRYDYDLPESLDAPVEAGEQVGTMSLVFADEVLGTVSLLAADGVEASRLLLALNAVKTLFASKTVKLITAAALALLLLYLILMVRANKRRRQRRRSASRYRDMYK